MVLARDLRFNSDELGRLAELLLASERRMKDDVHGEADPRAPVIEPGDHGVADDRAFRILGNGASSPRWSNCR